MKHNRSTREVRGEGGDGVCGYPMKNSPVPLSHIDKVSAVQVTITNEIKPTLHMLSSSDLTKSSFILHIEQS